MGLTRISCSVACAAVILALGGSTVASPSLDHLTSGSADPAGGALVAGNHGASYELKGGAILALTPGSQFSFEPSIHLKLGKPGEPETLTRVVHLVRGRADVSIPSRSKDPTAVMVRGPGKMNAVSKEGQTTFLATSDDRQTVAARKGEMLVGVGPEWKALHEGLARTAAPEDPAATPRPILSAPTASSDKVLAMVPTNDVADVSVNWQPMKDAASYEVTLTRAGGWSSIVDKGSTDTTASFGSLGPGAYELHVAALDKSGLSGATSAALPVRVVGVEVPDGAVVDSGAILLGRDQRVHLVAAEGLEVGYGNSQMFGEAPNMIGLAHNEATVARLRVPHTTAEAVLKLEPLGLHASVDIAPHVARWPLDHVTVTVELSNAGTLALAEDMKVDARVTVNLVPVDVTWARTGKTMTATLPAPTVPGPWVVRAEIRTDRGELIGRNFLEVARVESRAGATAANR